MHTLKASLMTRCRAPWFLAFVVVLGTAGCGSSSSAGGGASTGNGNSASAQSAAKVVAGAEAAPGFQKPGAPFDGSKLQGKTIYYIGVNMALPYVDSILGGVRQAAGLLGMHVKVCDGKGDVPTMNACMETAVSQHPAEIHLQAVLPALVSQWVTKAQSEGIPVTDGDNRSSTRPAPKGIFAQVTRNWFSEARTLADYVYSKGGQGSNVAIFTDPTYPPFVDFVDSFKTTMRQNCSGCTVKVATFNLTNAATSLPGVVQTTLQAAPNIKWVVMPLDVLAYVDQGIRLTGRSDVRIVGTDAGETSASFAALRSGQQEAGLVIDTNWKGWETIDEIGRAILHVAPGNEVLPNRLVTKANLPNSGLPGSLFTTNYQALFRKLWNR